MCQLSNTSILAETKIEIMQCAVAKCPKVCISATGIQIPPLIGFWQQSDTALAVIL